MVSGTQSPSCRAKVVATRVLWVVILIIHLFRLKVEVYSLAAAKLSGLELSQRQETPKISLLSLLGVDHTTNPIRLLCWAASESQS